MSRRKREPRGARQAIAADTLAILERGGYQAPSGRAVTVADSLDRAVRGTVLHRPADLDGLVDRLSPHAGGITRIEVTGETTLAAARRLATGTPGRGQVACLNFASARNPGGGFLGGAQAQEEALARSSGLYAALISAREFYDFHSAQRDLRYSDHVIYSPGVPVFRDDPGRLLEEPYEVAFLTAAAPNKGAIRERSEVVGIPAVLRRRTAKVLAVAHHHGHRRLVLGAWGCGVFRNDPTTVADAFAGALLGDGVFAGRFDHVVFAIWDVAPGAPRLAAFRAAFPGTGRTGA